MKDVAGKRVLKNAGLMFSAKGLGAVFALAGLAFAARGLSPAEFGLLVFIHTYVLFFTEVATFESWIVVVKHASNGLVGDDAGKDDPGWFGRVVRFCVTMDLAAALIGTTLAITGLLVLRDHLEIVDQAAPYLIAYISLIFLNQKSASLGILRLYNRYDVIAANSLIIPFGRMAGCGLAWAFDAPLVAYIASWYLASAISYLNLPLLCFLELRRRAMWAAVISGGLSLRAPMKGLWRFIVMTNIDSAIAAGSAQLPVLLAGSIGGASYAAIFRVAQEVAIVLSKGAKMIDKVIFPEFTDLIAKGEGNRIPSLVLRTGATLMAVGAAVGVVIWAFGPYLLAVALGADYAAAGMLAVLLICGASLDAAAASSFPALYAVGQPGRAILARASGVLTMTMLFVVFYHAYGDNGPGAAVVAGSFLTILLVGVFIARVDWSQLPGQTAISASRTVPGSSPEDAPKAGGPGQPGSSDG